MPQRSEWTLRSLREMTLRMGDLAESILEKSLRSVWERSADLAAEVREDDLEIDRLELHIDEALTKFLGLTPPLARDLRQVLAIKGIAMDLERVGDLARNIAKSSVRLTEKPPLASFNELRALAESARRVLRESVESFANLDPELARRVLDEDDTIDDEEDRLVRASIVEMKQKPESVEAQLDAIYIARALERVADHATNIAEAVVMVAEALNVKHAKKLAG